MQRLTLSFLNKYRDHGLLVIRVGLGIMFIGHGWPKMIGGPERWAKVGGAMSNFGVTFAPEFWGFMAAFAELGGGILLALGLFTRPALILLFTTMIVAATRHLMDGDAFFKGASHAIEAAVVFAGLFLIGPGRFSLDHLLFDENGDDDAA